MSYQLLNKENNKVKIEVVVSNAEFAEYVEKAYLKTRSKFNIQGFRKGKAPRKVIEMNYGEGVFYDEAINAILPIEYDKAVTELGLTPVDRPEVDVVEVGKDVDLKITFEVDVRPEVILGEYKGLEVKKPAVEVKEEDVEMELQKMQEMNARMVVVEGRNVEDGDIVTIDYKGFLGEEPFEGGTAENHALTIGSNEFIPGFEEQLIGAEIGSDVKVEVSFPEDYHAENLAGQAVVFEVKIHEIKAKELPELDDDFAMDSSEFDTLEELKESFRKKLEEESAKSAENFVKNSIVDQAVANVEVEIPNGMIESELEFMLKDMEYQLQYSGFNLEQYLSITGTTLEDLKEQMKEDAINRVKTLIVLEKIAEIEKIEITEEELKAEIAVISETQNTPLEEVEKIYSRDDYSYLRESLTSKKVVDLLVENAKIVE
ncbi:MAG: trigger factor [Clostridiales bacterium]|nr:trigger factor [Clostridiales bacterium]